MVFSDKKVAIVHEWFVDYSGSERVVEQLINIFPHADLFAVVENLPDNLKWFIKNKPVKTTFIQKLPFAKKKYRSYLPLMPLAIEQLDVSEYDIVFCSSHAVSKGVITNVNQLHISYCHSPIRYAWDLYHQYLTESGLSKGIKGFFAKLILHYIRIWDVSTSNRVDQFIANSKYIARRIRKVYGRESEVIYPPVAVESYEVCTQKQDYYVTLSRLVPYKKVDIIVEAFNKMPDKKLIVLGDGTDFNKIAAKAGANVQMKGFLETAEVRKYMSEAKAYIFAADEDFGITNVEAQAAGTPVIAFGKGGSLESIIEGETGIFFKEQTAESIVEAVEKFESQSEQFDPLKIRENAERFSEANFRKQITDLVLKKLEE